MLAGPKALALAALLLAIPGRADPGAAPLPAAAHRTGPSALALSKLRALLFHRPAGLPLKVPTSPRYLTLEDPSLSGTELLVGWVIPGVAPAAVPDLKAFAEALASALRARAREFAVPFETWVSLDLEGDAPLVVVELSSRRPGAARLLEEELLAVALGVEGGATRLSPLARAVVEVHRPGVPAPARSTKPARHIIERGDTLSQIARAHGLDLERLAKLNGLDVKRPLRPGDELRLSDSRPALPKLYVARKGDDLAKVARRFGISEKALMDANRLEGRRLTNGQKLVLPR
jgi:LysM repeat protein